MTTYRSKHKGKGLCRNCKSPLFFHGWCLRHWVYRFALRRGLNKKQWYLDHEKEFVMAIKGRWNAFSYGETPGEIEDIVVIFKRRPHKWVSALQSEVGRQCIRDMIKAMDLRMGRMYGRTGAGSSAHPEGGGAVSGGGAS